jgi:protein required for attachment to host cells
MFERIVQPEGSVTWVLIADGREAHLHILHKTMQKIPLAGTNKHHYYNEKSGYELIPLQGGILKAESIDDYQIGHDRRGTSSRNNSSAHNTYEPEGDITEELKRRFAKAIATRLHQAYMGKYFSHLVLVAPANIMGAIREHLTDDVQRHVVGTLIKELIPFHGAELMAHLQATLSESSHTVANAALMSAQ